MKQNYECPGKKRAYQKPFLRIIRLEAEEVLGVNCVNSLGSVEFPLCDFGNPPCIN